QHVGVAGGGGEQAGGWSADRGEVALGELGALRHEGAKVGLAGVGGLLEAAGAEAGGCELRGARFLNSDALAGRRRRGRARGVGGSCCACWALMASWLPGWALPRTSLSTPARSAAVWALIFPSSVAVSGPETMEP